MSIVNIPGSTTSVFVARSLPVVVIANHNYRRKGRYLCFAKPPSNIGENYHEAIKATQLSRLGNFNEKKNTNSELQFLVCTFKWLG